MKKIKRILIFSVVINLFTSQISNFFKTTYATETSNIVTSESQNTNMSEESNNKENKINSMIKNLDFSTIKKSGKFVTSIGLCGILLSLLKDTNTTKINNESVYKLLTKSHQECRMNTEIIREIIQKKLSIEAKIENIRKFCLELSSRTDCRNLINSYYDYMIYVYGNIKNNSPVTVITQDNYRATPECELLKNIIKYWKELDLEMDLPEQEIYNELQTEYLKNKNTWLERFESFTNIGLIESQYFVSLKLFCDSFKVLVDFQKLDYIDNTKNSDFIRFTHDLENIKQNITKEYKATNKIGDKISDNLKLEINNFLEKYFENISGFEEKLYVNIDDLHGKKEIYFKNLIRDFCKNKKLKPAYVHIEELLENYI